MAEITVSPEFSYVRLTKLCELPRPRGQELTDASIGEGLPGHHLGVGYFVDGWFLEAPQVGRGMLLLRFCRNKKVQLGLFTSSNVTFVSDTEMRTVNSVYRVERRRLWSRGSELYDPDEVSAPAPGSSEEYGIRDRVARALEESLRLYQKQLLALSPGERVEVALSMSEICRLVAAGADRAPPA